MSTDVGYHLFIFYRYTDQLGQLWNSLADYYIRSGLFERARDIYEEAIQTVTTVRDFTQV
jgi:pre-mRNA-splicing factor SYF1